MIDKSVETFRRLSHLFLTLLSFVQCSLSLRAESIKSQKSKVLQVVCFYILVRRNIWEMESKKLHATAEGRKGKDL